MLTRCKNGPSGQTTQAAIETHRRRAVTIIRVRTVTDGLTGRSEFTLATEEMHDLNNPRWYVDGTSDEVHDCQHDYESVRMSRP